MNTKEPCKLYKKTHYGELLLGDSQDILKSQKTASVDLFVTSPPFALLTQKSYGNVHADLYCEWFKPFAKEFYRVLKETGSLVIDMGGTWNQGIPTKHLYHFKLLLMLCEEFQFHLAQDFYWWNPNKLPTPSEWVSVQRIRVKDAINMVWWLSKTPWPKSNNKRVLVPYSSGMINSMKYGCKSGKRPSGHRIKSTITKNNGGAICSNLLAISNT